ncbi:MAG: DUF4846 domain-containing protein [Hyphomicrobiaceae bacterium]
MHFLSAFETSHRSERKLRPAPVSRLPALVMLTHLTILIVVGLIGASNAVAGQTRYPWRAAQTTSSPQSSFEALSQQIPPPIGFQRLPVGEDSFAAWLRGLPMKPAGAPVMLHTGAKKWRQDAHVGVVDIDVGKRDLQQCADAVMRLRAEYLWSKKRKSDIGFNYTGGGHVAFSRWARGDRPSESGKRWRRRARPDASYKSFRRYMIQIFAYAGTYSLAKELKPVALAKLRSGDVFIKGGFPGHAVLVGDVVYNPQTGERRFLLLQSFMPAQDIHVLKNPSNANGSPWYNAAFDGDLITPEWRFKPSSLKTWPKT